MKRRPAHKRPPGEGLHLHMVNGETVRLRRFETFRLMQHRYMVSLYILIWVGLTLVDPSGQTLSTPFDQRLSQYGAGVIVVVATLNAIYTGSELLFGGRGRVVTLSHPPVVLVVSILGLAASEAVAFYLSGDARITVKIFAVLTVFYFVIIEILLQLVVWLLLPRMLASIRHEAPPPSPSADVALNPVRAGGAKLIPDAILHMEAQGNYVTVVTDARSYEVPGPFAALLDQVPDGLGLRIHRSHWVARRAVLGHRRKGREMVLDLTYGGVATVALPRQAEVVDWLVRTAAAAPEDRPRQANDASQG